MYGRDVGGRTLTFGVSGKLYANGLVIYDHQTESLWSHVRGEALSGPLAGTRLTPLPAMHTTWAAWRRLHPGTLVLDPARSPHRRDYSRDPYEGYYYTEKAGVLGAKTRDARLTPKQFVVGVRRGGSTKAYPFAALSRTPVVNDDVGGPVVVVFDEATATAAVFERRAGGRTLTFEAAGHPSAPSGRAPMGTPRMRDRETGTVWHGLTGEALEGPLAGRRLTPVPVTYAFWFGWRDHHPETALYLPGPATGSGGRSGAGASR